LNANGIETKIGEDRCQVLNWKEQSTGECIGNIRVALSLNFVHIKEIMRIGFWIPLPKKLWDRGHRLLEGWT
jgi:hypothetical protein